jgi:hypothetical protein
MCRRLACGPAMRTTSHSAAVAVGTDAVAAAASGTPCSGPLLPPLLVISATVAPANSKQGLPNTRAAASSYIHLLSCASAGF